MEAAALGRRLSSLGAHAAQHRAMPLPAINAAPAQGLGSIWVWEVPPAPRPDTLLFPIPPALFPFLGMKKQGQS